MRDPDIISKLPDRPRVSVPPDIGAVSVKILEERTRYVLRIGGEVQARSGAKECPLDMPINSCRQVRGVIVARLGPDEWFLAGRPVEVVTLVENIGISLSDSFHCLVEISHRNAGIVISGSRALDLLNGGCALDLSLKAFPPGTATRTLFGKIEVLLLLAPQGDSYEIECWRSYLPYLHKFCDELAIAVSAIGNGENR